MPSLRSIPREAMRTLREVRRGLPFLRGELLTRLSARCSPRLIFNLQKRVNYLETSRWLRDGGFRIPRRARTKDEVFAAVTRQVANKQVLYLEFGVYEGDTMRYWCEHLRNPNSRLHGFDSFEGLPETWTLDRPKGCFSTLGKVPLLDDPRVEFFKGWFEDALCNHKPQRTSSS